MNITTILDTVLRIKKRLWLSALNVTQQSTNTGQLENGKKTEHGRKNYNKLVR